jgi:hypothetical protein
MRWLGLLARVGQAEPPRRGEGICALLAGHADAVSAALRCSSDCIQDWSTWGLILSAFGTPASD